MKANATRLLFALAVAGATAGQAGALNLDAQAGATYTRSTFAPELAASQTLPHFELDLRLDAKGFYDRRGLLDWTLGVGYRRITDDLNGAPVSRRNFLTYAAGAVLNGDNRGLVKAIAQARRFEHRFTTDAANDVYGDGITNSATVLASGNLPRKQAVALGYSWTDRQDEIPGTARHDFTQHGLTGRLGFGGPDFEFSGEYRGRLSTGTWDSDKFDEHVAGMTSRANLFEGAVLLLQDNYLLFKPRVLGIGLYPLERNDFSLSVLNGRPNGERQVVQYFALRSNLEPAPGTFTEATRQSLRWEGDFRLDGVDSPVLTPDTDQRLFLRPRLDTSFGRTRTPLATGDSWGETAGAEVWWFRQDPARLLEVHAGPLVALSQPDGLKNEVGYGFRGGARYMRPIAAHSASLGYNLDFGSRLYGSDVWTLTNDLYASMTGPLSLLRYTLYARAIGSKVSSPSFGDSATRSLELRAGAQYRRLQTEAVAAFTDGISPTTPQSFVADGLFIPAPYDAHTRDLSLRATLTPYPGLRLEASGRSVASDRPGQPVLSQTEARGAIDYSFGGLVAGVEYRAIWYDQNGGGQTTILMFRLYRRLGFIL